MSQQKILAFRQAFKELPLDIRRTEVERLVRVVNRKPVVYLVLNGRSTKILSVADAVKFLKSEGVAKPDRSYITKALKGQRPSLYSFDVVLEYEFANDEREE